MRPRSRSAPGQHDERVVARALGDVGAHPRAARHRPRPDRPCGACRSRSRRGPRRRGRPDPRRAARPRARADPPPRARRPATRRRARRAPGRSCARTREEGRATTALPATSAEAATTVGTHTGELAACQPSTTPKGRHSSRVVPETAGTGRGRIASASSGGRPAARAPRPARARRSAAAGRPPRPPVDDLRAARPGPRVSARIAPGARPAPGRRPAAGRARRAAPARRVR